MNEERNFNLIRTIKGFSDHKLNKWDERVVLDGINSHINHNVKNVIPWVEERSTLIGTDITTPTNKVWDLITPLRNNIVSVQAGAQLVQTSNNLLEFPLYNGTLSGWKTELEEVYASGTTFNSVVLRPHRLSCRLDVSLDFLNQTFDGCEEILKKDMIESITSKLEDTIFGKHIHSTDRPDGMYTGFSGSTFSGSTSYTNITGMEETLTNNNFTNISYITNGTGRKLLRNTQKVSSTGEYILENDNMILGHPLYITNSIPKEIGSGNDEHGIVAGDFSNLIIVLFGNIEFTIDNKTKVKDGYQSIYLETYWDVYWKRPNSFVLASLK